MGGFVDYDDTFVSEDNKTLTDLIKVRDIEIDSLVSWLDFKTKHAVVTAVTNFYNFWHYNDPRYLNYAISPSFTDHGHPGRAPGIQGLQDAANGFRKVVSGFSLRLERLIIAQGDDGTFATAQGRVTGFVQGDKTRTVNFIFTDVLRLVTRPDGTMRISDNWPLEDTDTLNKQLRAAEVG
jgi:SnoaL-like polyketide cyclase